MKYNEPITNILDLQRHHINRQGFIFTSYDFPPNIFDRIVIRSPSHCDCWSPTLGVSEISLDDHIRFINEYHLDKAFVIAEDIEFILRCPTLTDLVIFPADTAQNGFDYSPLYGMPLIKSLTAQTTYSGVKGKYHTTIDYSKIHGLVELKISGKGHIGYNKVQSLRKIDITSVKNIELISDISYGIELEDISLTQCTLKRLEGIEKYRSLSTLNLFNNRLLTDISDLEYISDILTTLSIENCPNISDFSVLSNLVNLEHLQLDGSNVLPDLNFLSRMPKLKTFVFTMDVSDGNLSNCMLIPYVSCKNRRHYNLKDSQLPKNLN